MSDNPTEPMVSNAPRLFATLTAIYANEGLAGTDNFLRSLDERARQELLGYIDNKRNEYVEKFELLIDFRNQIIMLVG